MNVWEEDDAARNAVMATGRKRLIVAGFLTEACVSLPALSALDAGFEVFVVSDACGGLTLASHELALRRLEQAAAPYDAARAVVVANGGGYGTGLAYAREMIHPG